MTEPQSAILHRGKELSPLATGNGDSIIGETLDQLGTLSAGLRNAETYRDNDLTFEANLRKQTELRESATQRASNAVGAIARKATKAAHAARVAVERYELDASSVDASAATAVWEQNIRPTLESGPFGTIDWQGLTSRASAKELAALRIYLPSWVRRNVPANGLSRELRDAEAARIVGEIDDAAWRRGIELNGGSAALANAERAAKVERAVSGALTQVSTGRLRTSGAVAAATLNLKTVNAFG